MEFDLASPTGKLSKETPAEITLDGRFLYGAPASNLDLEGEMKVKAAEGRPGFAGYQFGVNDDEDDIKTEQVTLEDLPADRRQRQGEVHRHARQAAEHLASARGRRSRCGWSSPAGARSSATSRSRSCRARP